MFNAELIHRPVLDGVEPFVSDRIRLAPLPEGAVLQLFCAAEHEVPLARAAALYGLALRASGPGQWYLIANAPVDEEVRSDLAAALPAGSWLLDQSHGRVRIAVEGDAVEHVLAKGTGIDLALFEIGAATNTLMGHIPVHMSRTARTRFELMPLRSFAADLWSSLSQMAAEYATSSMVSR